VRKNIREMAASFDLNFYVIYGVGIVGYALPWVRPLMLFLTPAVLLLTAAYAFVKTLQAVPAGRKTAFLVWCAAVFIVTIVLEALGVRYGLFFGEYDYGGALGPAVAGVPLIIGVNWLIVIMGAAAYVRKYTPHALIVALLAGLAAFLFDFIMEPAAIALGYWEWVGPIPVKNYVSWFSITFLGSLVAVLLRIPLSSRWAPALLGAQTAFFLCIRLLMVFGLL